MRHIPDRAIEAAAKAMVVREALEQDRTEEEAEWRWLDIRDGVLRPYRLNARAAILAFLTEVGAEEETEEKRSSRHLAYDPRQYQCRIVTRWEPVSDG